MNRITKTVPATLRNARREYSVHLVLQVRELWGQRAVPDDYVVEEISLAPGVPVEDDDYTLEYSFNGRQEQQQLRVAHGRLLSRQ